MKKEFNFKKEIKKQGGKMIKEIFWTGETEMGVAWLMLIIGLLLGFAMKVC